MLLILIGKLGSVGHADGLCRFGCILQLFRLDQMRHILHANRLDVSQGSLSRNTLDHGDGFASAGI